MVQSMKRVIKRNTLCGMFINLQDSKFILLCFL